MASKNWAIQDSKRKNDNTVELWLAYKQNSESVIVTYTDDKLVDIAGENSLPQYIRQICKVTSLAYLFLGVVVWGYASTASSQRVK